MPNRVVHRTTGAAAGLAISLVETQGAPREKRTVEVIAAMAGGVAGAAAPDWIDPPTSPNHRSMGHSIVIAGGGLGVAISNVDIWRAALQSRAAASFSEGRTGAGYSYLIASGLLTGFIVGYASHLILDAGTPKGLPLVK